MTSQPDYKIIDACLEKVVRPIKEIDEGDGPHNVALVRHNHGWCWTSDTKTFEPSAMRLDDSDAMAVVSVCVINHLLKTSYCTIEAWASHYGGVQFAASSSGTMAYHPDRTTALCLLALRVAGKETA